MFLTIYKSMYSRICPVAVLISLFLLLNVSTVSTGFQQKPTPTVTIYNLNRDHPWNQLHRILFVRTGLKEEELGQDEVDPLLWPETKHLLTGKSHVDVLKALDELIKHDAGADKIRDPLKRAVLQHDLLSVFDWSAFLYNHLPSGSAAGNSAPRKALQKSLAHAIQRLSLTPQAIEALQDNYSLAIRAKTFPAAFDPNRPGQPFLPPDLFEPEGQWVCVRGPSDSPNEAIASAHTIFFSGRSVFLVFMRLPGGRKETLTYLERLSNFPSPWVMRKRKPTDPVRNDLLELTSDLPQFPVGTQVALVRQMVLVNEAGELAASRLTESVQLRVYRQIPAQPYESREAEIRKNQSFFEFDLRRGDLFEGKTGGLRLVGEEELAYKSLQFITGWSDPFEMLKDEHHSHIMTVMSGCRSCHSDSGIYSVNSYTRRCSERQKANLGLWPTLMEEEQQKVITWKQNQYDWGLFRGLTDR
jgi:hypothetical protein